MGPLGRRRAASSFRTFAAVTFLALSAVMMLFFRSSSRSPASLLRSPLAKARATVSTAAIAGTPTAVATYGKLCERLKEINQLSGVSSILGWDEQTMMPSGAAGTRGQQKSVLAAVIHEKQTDPALGQLLEDIKGGEELECDFARANCRDAQRDYKLETAKSKEIARREAELEAESFNAWVQARKDDDFNGFEPKLTEMFQLKKEVAKLTRPHLPIYDGALDAFERGMPSTRLDDIFGELKKDLVPLVKSVIDAGDMKLPAALTDAAWPVDTQAELCLEIAKDLGFDTERGRFDVSVHPFTGGVGPSDVRITTRYNEKNWMEGIGGTIHEVGHALYEQGRSQLQQDLPVSRALSMGVHESQSLLWERMVFQGKAFWQYATPIIHKYFPHTKDVDAMEFYRAVNRVQPGLIRTEADELTYPLHIMLRYGLEKAMLEGETTVAELPSKWNAEMKESLDIDVPSNAMGCLQDVHWSVGAIGYFPSYSLGAMMAAQFYEAAKKAIPDLEEQIAKGNFSPLKTWLNENIHTVGSLYESPDELLTVVTGKPLDTAIYMKYLREKYSELYSL